MGNLLDFGAGTGLLWDFFQDLDLHTQGESSTTHLKGRVRFIGIDLSRGMLQTFKNKVLKTKKTPPIDPRDAHLICCDGEHLPLRADLFSNVIALTTLQNLPNLHIGIQEMHRVSIQGGFQRISFLRKSIPKEELIKEISSKFDEVKLIEPKVGHNTSYSEDWIILAKKE